MSPIAATIPEQRTFHEAFTHLVSVQQSPGIGLPRPNDALPAGLRGRKLEGICLNLPMHRHLPPAIRRLRTGRAVSICHSSPVGVGHAAKHRKKRKKTPAKTSRMLKEAHGDVSVSETRVFDRPKVSRGLGDRPGRRALRSALNASHHCNGEKCAWWVKLRSSSWYSSLTVISSIPSSSAMVRMLSRRKIFSVESVWLVRDDPSARCLGRAPGPRETFHATRKHGFVT